LVSSKSRKKLLETELELSRNKQLKLLSVSKSSLYYKSVLPFVSDLDEKILSTIDKIYTKYPYYGHRRVHKLLGRLGFIIGRKRVRSAMKKMAIVALYPKPKTTISNKEHIQILVDNNIDISMDGKGRAIDNIVIERFWRSLKYEDVYPQSYSSIKEARTGIGKYINIYNTQRLHQSLDYATPDEIYFKGDNNQVFKDSDLLLNVAS